MPEEESWVVRTDEDVWDGPLVSFLLQVILELLAILPLVESRQSIITNVSICAHETDDINADSMMAVWASEYLSFRSALAFFEYGHQLLENTTTVFSATAFCSHAY